MTDGSGMAEEFLKVTEELDGMSSLSRRLGSRRAALADGLIAAYGVQDAAVLADTTVGNLSYLAARHRYETALERGDDDD